MSKIFTETYVRKATGTAWNKVVFDDEQFEKLLEFLQEMFPDENQEGGFDFPIEGEFKITQLDIDTKQ